jgi:predicted ATP-grasp superfamily ATP-dependent carboligase
MIAIVTDVRYRMSLAVIRDAAEAGIEIVAVERDDSGAPPIGFYSKYVHETHMLHGVSYVSELYALCRDTYRRSGKKPALLPVGASTLAVIAPDDVRERFSGVCGLCMPTQEQLDLFNSKSAVAEMAQSLGIPVPRAWAIRERAQITYPCVVKPICGEKQGLSASERYVIARDEKALGEAYSHFLVATGGVPLIQEYLGGGGAGCSVLARDGRVVSSLCHVRVREWPISGGPSACCRAVHDPTLESFAAEMVKNVNYTGLAMVEFKQGLDGKYRLLEINPRVWGSYPTTRVAKSGMSLAWFAEAWNAGNPNDRFSPPPLPPYREVKMHFLPSDMMSGFGYLRAGKPEKFFGAVADLFNPAVKNGLFEWSDARPGREYYRSLLRKK